MAAWDLLDETTREALLACACFEGGFSADALGQDALDRLTGAALVRVTMGRFELLQAVRLDARERLHACPELERAYFRRHAEAMARAARRWREAARATGGAAYLFALARDHDNLVAALTRSLDEPAGDLETARLALTLAVELEPIRMLRGHPVIYVDWVRRALGGVPQGAEDALHELRFRATLCEGRALSELGETGESRAAFERALALARDASGEGHARCGLARLDAHAGRWREALRGFAEVKVCAVRARDEALLQVALASESFYGSELGDAEEQSNPLESAAAFFRAAGDERESLFWGVQAGRAYTDFDRPARAHARLNEEIARAQAIGDRRGEGFATFAMGGVFLSRCEPREASDSYRSAAQMLEEVGKERERGYALGYLGVAEHLRGRFEEAEAAYRAGCGALSAVSDMPNAALFSLFQAALLADRDRTSESADQLDRALASVEEWAGSGMRSIVAEVLGAPLDAAFARAAWESDDFEGFATHRRAAEARLRIAETRPESIESARAVYDWRDVSLDVRAAVLVAKRACEGLASLRMPARCVIVEGGCGRIRLPDDPRWIDLRSRRVPRRVLAKLVDARVRAPGAAVPAPALVEAGWPGERMPPRSAANRLHVTLGLLRALGLRDLIEHAMGGWRLSPDVPIVRAT
jgi:tetratricopeptide (TPR) repeat protein